MRSKLVEVSLGVVTGIGGFLDIGSITTSAQAGAIFGFELSWAIVLGVLCVMFLTEQSGRLSALSRSTITDAIRERFGFTYFAVLLAVLGLVTLILLGAELGGVCVALEFVTGMHHRWWAVPVALVTWLILWKGGFSTIEQGSSGLGLVTLCFVVAAVLLHPDWLDLAKGALPGLPSHDTARYWFLASNILGASITPYLMFFYSSGAIEDKWDRTYLAANRAIAGIGMGFGGFVALGVLVTAAQAFGPREIQVDQYAQVGLLLTDALGRWGFWLLAASLGIACLSAGLEVTLSIAYMAAQGLGWNGSQDGRPRDNARFCTLYTLVIVAAMLIMLTGVDPIRLTNIALALTAATLPIAVLPFLFIMNDETYVGAHTNGWISNAVVLFCIVLACVLAVATLPLELLGGG